MNKIEDLIPAIDDHKPRIRVKDAKILDGINTLVIYKRAILALRSMVLGSPGFTAAKGDLGKKILEGYEDLSQPEKKTRKVRQAVGGEIYRILFNHKIFELKRDADEYKVEREAEKSKLASLGREETEDEMFDRKRKKEKKSKSYKIHPITEVKLVRKAFKYRGKTASKVIEVKREHPFIDDLFKYCPFDDYIEYNRPIIGDANERESFTSTTDGELVHSINYANLDTFSPDNSPLLYEIANKQDDIMFRINAKVLDVVNKVQHIDLFTYNNLKVDTEGLSPKHIRYKKWKLLQTKTGRKRENNLVLDEAVNLGNKVFKTKHYFDFRTRLYPSVNYLNYAGSKLAKSLYYFVCAKPLGENGWNKLLMSTANCWGNDGVDKKPISERIDWAEDNLDWILDIADDAENDLRWTEADDPFNFLAHILELKAAVDSGDEYSYVCGLPIHLDATCSGLQVLSALSKDFNSGKLCNLTDCDIRGDYYLHIADYVWKKLEKKKGASAEFWRSMYDNRRKICKRSGMTFFYSCGAETMGDHIYEDFEWEKGFGKLTMQHSSMLGNMIYEACVKLMPGPSKLMNLFVAMGMLEAEDDKDLEVYGPVNKTWMIQNYRNDVSSKIQYIYKKRRINLRYYSERGKTVRKSKVKTASSPNIVHFLDSQIVAALLLFTDYNIITIHDSFACVPADVDKLYVDTRKVFVDIFDTNLLEEIVEPFIEKAIKTKEELRLDIDILKQAVDFHIECEDEEEAEKVVKKIKTNKNLIKQFDLITDPIRYGDLDVKEVSKNQYFTS